MDYSCKSMPTVAVIMLLMLVYAGCASASFKRCYSNCYEDCVAGNGEVTVCITKCIFKCVGKQTNSCISSCAVDQCPRFGKDVAKVEDCIDKCGNNKCV